MVHARYQGTPYPDLHLYVAAIVIGTHLDIRPELQADPTLAKFLKISTEFKMILKGYTQKRLFRLLESNEFSSLFFFHVSSDKMKLELGLGNIDKISSEESEVKLLYRQSLSEIECRCESRGLARLTIPDQLSIPQAMI